MVLACGGHLWIVLARGGHWWVVLARGGHCRFMVACGGHYWGRAGSWRALMGLCCLVEGTSGSCWLVAVTDGLCCLMEGTARS